MRTSDLGVEMIKKFEGLRLHAYEDVAGVWTIGYGHTGSVEPAMVIDEDQAEALLIADLIHFENGVQRELKREPMQYQFDAMVSLAYNIGLRNFSRCSVLFFFNKGDFDQAKVSFGLWDKARIDGVLTPIEGLRRRRAKEAEVFADGYHEEDNAA